MIGVLRIMKQYRLIAQVSKIVVPIFLLVAIVVCIGFAAVLGLAQQPPGTIATADSRCKLNGAQCNGVQSNCWFRPWAWNNWWQDVGGTCDICTTNGRMTNWCFDDPNWDCVIAGETVYVTCANRTRGQCVVNATGNGAACAVVPGNPIIGTCTLALCRGSIPHPPPGNP